MRNIILFACIWLFSTCGFAHGPTPQKAKESIVIHTNIEKAWTLVKQFDEIARWHPDLKKSDGDGKNQSGGVRYLTFKNGETLSEELDYFNENDHEYSYRLKTENTKAFPLSSYSADLKIAPGSDSESCQIIWKARYYRGNTGNNPPPHLTDEAAVKAMTQFIRNGLNGIKSNLE